MQGLAGVRMVAFRREAAGGERFQGGDAGAGQIDQFPAQNVGERPVRRGAERFGGGGGKLPAGDSGLLQPVVGAFDLGRFETAGGIAQAIGDEIAAGAEASRQKRGCQRRRRVR